MSYQPGFEEMVYLVETQPEAFERPGLMLRSIRTSHMSGQPVNESDVAASLYQEYLDRGAEPLTESPIPGEPGDEESQQDPIFGACCVECDSQTPCIEQVEVVCHTHSESNTRVTLQGESELINTDGKIYFVADKFVTGDGTFEDFLAGTQLKDEGQVAITLADCCPHGHHTLTWIDELNGTELPPGATTTLDFTVMTRPVPPITLPSALMGLMAQQADAGLAFKAAVMLLDIIMNRTAMVNEQQFRISYDGTNDFCFTAVTLPQLKFDGLVTVAPPSVGTRFVEKSEGRELADQRGMGPRVRQVTERQGWGIHAGLTVICGAKETTITVGKSRTETQAYDTGPSLHQAENQRQQQSTVERFIGTLTNASQRIAKNISATESDSNKLLNFYTRGPELMLGATTQQAEEEGKPGASWEIVPGLSLNYECGIRLDIYAALKKAIERVAWSASAAVPVSVAAHSLLAFLNDAESGRDLWLFGYGLAPYLVMQVGLEVGPEPTEDRLGTHMLTGTYNVTKNAFDPSSVTGQVSITLKALIEGGVIGYFDRLFHERVVFKYGAQVSTSGSITIAIENGQWGYRLSHAGAVLRVQGYKKADADSVGDRRPNDGGFPTGNQSSSARVIEGVDGTLWEEDGSTHAYRLAESWTGAFHTFNGG